ncbi:molybdenum cofactor guanylyltransferase [Sphingomonas sp. MMS24-J45]|uniref:molybdenum cofactor guanylyltransferase n=1 Tax=Sphingomonas sp. MMS24-J45 TaxID=3238806 RepID=UPI00384C9125
MRLLGAILAGGRSRRFGSDKALADLDGEPMIWRVAEAIGPFVDAIVVCGHPAPPPGMKRVPDVPGPGLGPLGGLAGALHHALAEGYAGVLSVGCDTPVLDGDLLRQLREAERATFVADAPIIGYWPTELYDTLLAHLATDPRRSMQGWTTAIGADPIDLPRPIPNVNTPEDLAALSA